MEKAGSRDKNNPIIDTIIAVGDQTNGEKVAIAFELAAAVDLATPVLSSGGVLKCFA